MKKLFHPLDRYVFGEFWRVFLITACGFPLLVEVLDLAERIEKYIDRRLPRLDIALSYFYWLPESMFMVLPAAVLFATVFTIGSLTRHTELTAAKASGISFHRVIAPIFVGALLATVAGLFLGELVPKWNQKRLTLLQEQRFAAANDRYNFAFLSEDGRIYQIAHMRVDPPSAETIQIERLSDVEGVPDYVISAAEATYRLEEKAWQLNRGVMHVLSDSTSDLAFRFDSLVDLRMKERPFELSKSSRTPDDMGFRELGKYIEAMERSGADVNVHRVERMHKIAIPITCLIIVLFGAPLATSSNRGGASYGIGISLGATVLFILLIQLTKAFGGKAVIEPDLAAWIPSIVFGIFGAIMLARVRT
jgi:lipopolysaccharide export system permease protein